MNRRCTSRCKEVRTPGVGEVQKYLGICLLPQAGVAIVLAILASEQFEGQFNHFIIMVVMMGTFLMEILGPVLVKEGVSSSSAICVPGLSTG